MKKYYYVGKFEQLKEYGYYKICNEYRKAIKSNEEIIKLLFNEKELSWEPKIIDNNIFITLNEDDLSINIFAKYTTKYDECQFNKFLNSNQIILIQELVEDDLVLEKEV